MIVSDAAPIFVFARIHLRSLLRDGAEDRQ
jgi:hypothetical protein